MSEGDRFRRYADKETLERITRWPSLLSRFPLVRIYSAEHCAFWRGSGQGYVDSPEESQVWAIEDAVKRTKHCGPEKKIEFIEAEGTVEQRPSRANQAGRKLGLAIIEMAHLMYQKNTAKNFYKGLMAVLIAREGVGL